MATRIVLPKQGLQMTEGTIVSWLKKPGDAISAGEPIVEIETDKTTMQVESPVTGVVLAVLCKEGDAVPVASTIAIVGEPGEKVPEIGTQPAADTAAGSPARGAMAATPRARMRAEEKHVDLSGLTGSGPDGLIIERDVIRAAAAAPQMPAAPPRAAPEPARLPEGTLTPLSTMRRTIARRMRESLSTAAQATHEMDIDCSEMVRLKADLDGRQVEVSYTDIIVKALGAALRQHPLMSSTWTDQGILMREQVNVGVAVALDDGLIVPVIRGADSLSLIAIHARMRELTARAREGTLQAEDREGAGFTVSNLGMYGVDRFTAIIDQPQTGILAVGRIVRKPVVVGEEIAIRPQMMITLSYDHRVVDGAPAARFLQTVRQLLESPCLMM